MTGWMSSRVTDFLNTCEINADPLSGIITPGNLDIEKPPYRTAFVEAEVF